MGRGGTIVSGLRFAKDAMMMEATQALSELTWMSSRRVLRFYSSSQRREPT